MRNTQIQSLKSAAKHLYTALHGIKATVKYAANPHSLGQEDQVEATAYPHTRLPGDGNPTLVGVGADAEAALVDLCRQLTILLANGC